MIRTVIWDHPIPFLIIFVLGLAVALYYDELQWKRKSIADLVAMVNSTDPNRMNVGLSQLRKRKQDISSYIHNVIPFLMAESAMDRVAAKLVLKKHYPEDYLLIKGYEGTNDLEKCKENLSKLHGKYGISL